MEGRELRLQRYFLTQINQCQVCLIDNYYLKKY